MRRPEPKAQGALDFLEPPSPAPHLDARDQARAQDFRDAVAVEIVRQLGGEKFLAPHNCIDCKRFAFNAPTRCFWCRRSAADVDATAVDAAANSR